MKYQPLHDLIDPDVPARGAVVEAVDPDAPNDAYVIGENGATVQRPDERGPGADEAEAPRAWVRPAAAGLGLLFVVLTAWNLSRAARGPARPPQPTAFQVKQALYLGVMKVEAYRRVHGAAPEALSEAGLPGDAGYEYQRIGPTHYVLTFRADGSKVDYDSAIGVERFFGSPKDILKIGGTP